MLDLGMINICEKLIKDGHPLSAYKALEFYSREGDWHTKVYENFVYSLDAWEIEKKFEPALRRNLPNAQIKIVDSYIYGRTITQKFNFIVLDNPQGIFGLNNEYCEHFEALDIAVNLIDKKSIIIFNINKAPFNYNNQIEWQKRRNTFYNLNDTSQLSVDNFLIPFYKNKFENLNCNTIDVFEIERNPQYLSYLVFNLSKNET